ncbi:hypothetical protein ACF0H5_022753 [Mactra antiquata]
MDSNDTSGNTTQSVTESSVCSQLYPKAPTYYQVLTDLPVELTFICIAIILSILTIVIYVTEVFSKEYKLLKEPGKRRQILTLVFIYPMTSGMAMFAIIVPKSTVLVDLLASCYLSFCLYVFVRALIFYYGDTNNMIEANKSNQTFDASVKINSYANCSFTAIGSVSESCCMGKRQLQRERVINHIIIIFEMFILAAMARKVYHTSEHGNITVNVDTDKTEYNKVGDNAIEEHNGSSNKPL